MKHKIQKNRRSPEASPTPRFQNPEITDQRLIAANELSGDEEIEPLEGAAEGSSSDEPTEDELEEAYSGTVPLLPVPLPVIESETRALAPQDPLRRYLQEIKRLPLLNPEEELSLAQRLRESGDIGIARTLVSANLRLVVKIAYEYRTYYTNLLDLIQEGNVGLMKAVSRFDPTKGARLGYYASWWIRSYILKYLLDNFRLIRIGTTQAQKKLFYHLMREKGRLEAQGLLSGPKLLADKLNVRVKDVVEMEMRLEGRGAEMSLDSPVNSEHGTTATHLDFIADPHEGSDATLEHSQMLDLLRAQLPEFEKGLNAKEREILKERLLSDHPVTLQEVATRHSLTRERVRQIEAKLIARLRERIQRQT